MNNTGGLAHLAEQYFLGACLNSPSVYKTCGTFKREYWTDSKHAMIYTAIGFAIKNYGTCGVLEVAEELGDFKAKYSPYLAELEANCPATANAKAYADFARDHAKARLAHEKLSMTIEASLPQQGQTLDENWSIVKQGIAEVQSILTPRASYKTFSEAVDLALIERQRRRDGVFVSTTLPSLDSIMGGFRGPTLTVLGARTSGGKSLIAGQIAANAAVRNNHPVGIVSLEMGAGQIMGRMLRSLYGYGEESIPKDAPLFIDDVSRTLDDIVFRIHEWKDIHNIELAIIDYAQIIHVPGHRQRWEQIGEVSRTLKGVAMKLGIPILALAQLSREHIKTGLRPGLGDLRESGNLEQDADNVLLLHYIRDKCLFELIVAKQREGQTGDIIDLEFWKETLSLRERPL